ncbi:centromere/kinetochore protein zw10 [Stomoxys calcitrans]|uniref:centromere/kinetochore protein zw10 n=1 Tax=Stomoxys calcitrans TaxID=35570 RepID=UPI0027E3AEFC|nr:centromere/kinetochore protein zw10 [Stomoxys calcitrans]
MQLVDVKPEVNTNKCLENVQDKKLQIVTILEKIHRFKERVSKYIEDNYVEFLPNVATAYLYSEDGNNLEKQGYELLNSLQYSANSDSDAELMTTVKKLNTVLCDLDVTNRILAADEIFQSLEETSSNEHLIALDMLKKLNNIIHHTASSEVQKLLLASPAYDTIKVKYLLKLHMVKLSLSEKFKALVQMNEKQLPGAVCTTIQVSKDVGPLQDTVLALFQAKYDVTELCDFLLDKCLMPIITRPVNMTFSEENSEYLKLQICYGVTGGNAAQDYKQVFEHVKMLFHCLETLNVLVSNDHHVFAIVGENLANRFFKSLIDECLMNAIPETVEELQASTLVEDVLQFELYLADMFFINREIEQSLTKFTEKYETLFHNRMFCRLLETGREIMQKDLQEMVVMAEKNTPEDVTNNPFLFPRSMVSKSLLEFVKLLNRIIRQDSETPSEHNRYFNIISVLINSYVTLVPQYHKEHLENLPQQTALFYNNCMFLHQFLAKNFSTPTASNLVKNLSSCGSKHLRQQVDQQLAKLQNILQPASKGENKGKITNKMVDKCIHHLELLESLWQNVLPVKEYNKIMGELINNCCLLLNHQIVDKPSISAAEAKLLSETFGLFIDKAGSFIKAGQELQKLSNWQRLINLLDILNVTLTEIAEMWSAGKLSEHFKAEEIERLIRSLHPNTERRALALKKIF